MPDKFEDELTAATTIATNDFIRVMQEISGVLESRRISRANFITWLNSVLALGVVAKSAMVTKSANQTIANATTTTLTWNVEQWDNDAIHDNVTNNSRLVCKTAGKYDISLGVIWGSNNTGIRQLVIIKNGTTQLRGVIFVNNNSGEDQNQISCKANLAVNDYVEAQVYQASGGNLDVQGNRIDTDFSMTQVAA